jgi:predicted TIM-barrel fold metal-dependent hydrolase
MSDKQRIIDSSVHMFFRKGSEVRDFMTEPYKSRGIPDVEMDWYGAPGGEYDADIVKRSEGGYPGSDPSLVSEHLFGEQGVDIAILHPMTRGNLPDRHLNNAVLSAHNKMLVERWLEKGNSHKRFRGTIRVNPEDPKAAIQEIERWKDHPYVVQVGVPLQSRELYGKPQFFPLWEAAANYGLPVAAHIETGTGVDFAPTPSGHPRTYPQYATFMALNFLYHTMNMIAEGVFEALPKLKFIWADGGGDSITPFIWRMDTFGRPHLEQTPWAPRIPSSYLPDHVYFVYGKLDGPTADNAGMVAPWTSLTGKENMFLYGSSYPHWNVGTPDQIAEGLSDEQRQKILWKNAAELYKLELQAPVAS